MTQLFPRGARARVRSSGDIAWVQLSSFTRATLLVAASDAIGIGVGAAILGVPFASGITLLVFFGAFIPVIGAAVSGTVVEAFFGNKWIDAVPILMPLALAMILHALMAVAGPVLWGQGAAGRELKVQFWVALTLVAALLVAARFSMVAVAWAVLTVYAIRLAWMTVVLMLHIQLPLTPLLRALRGGALAGTAIVALLLMADTRRWMAMWNGWCRGTMPLKRLCLNRSR